MRSEPALGLVLSIDLIRWFVLAEQMVALPGIEPI